MAQSSLKLWFGILMALPTLLSAQELDLAGEWETTWGDASFSRIEGGYDGSYDTDGGRIRLLYTVDGSYEGEWSESESDQRCETPSPITGSYYWGRIIGPLLNRSEGLIFKWSHCEQGAFNNSWQFNRGNTPSVPENTRAGFDGNWRVTWEDSSQSEGLISIYKPFKWDCTHKEDSWCQKRVEEGSGLSLNGGQLNPGADGHPGGKVALSEGLMNITWGYGHFGKWGGKSSIKYVNDNYLYGEWSGGGLDGKASWRRVNARVNATGTLVQGVNGQHYIDRKPLGQPVTITTNYLGSNYKMRGTRKSVVLDLYGQNLWGIHDYYLPRESGIEISRRYFLCADGQVYGGTSTSSICIKRGGLLGLRLTFVIWSDARPGLHYLKFDDQKIPFNLEIKGHDAQFVAEAPQTTIMDLVLLDDQVGQRQQESARVKNYSYPYDRRGYITGGLNTRLLAVIGKNLDFDGQNFLSSEDASVSYQRLTLPANIQSAVNRAAAHLSNKPIAADEEVITVRADLKRGVRGGVKHLLVNGAPKSWSLVFNDQIGHLQFLRAGSTPNDLRERRFYNGETIYIGVKARNDNYPIDNFDVVLEAKKYSALTPDSNEVRRLARITLRRTDNIRLGEKFAKSTAILLNRTEEDTGGSAFSPVSAPVSFVNGKLEITLQPGERLVARPDDRFSLITVPPVISADIWDRPRRSALWQYALEKVAQCPGVGGDPNATEFPSKPSKVFTNWILTDAVVNLFQSVNRTATREITVTKGDHAALILIRDELLPLIKVENEKLRQYIGAGDHGNRLAGQFYGLAVQTPGSAQNAFWSERKETWSEFIGGTILRHEVTLAQLLDINASQNLLARTETSERRTRIDVREKINEIVAKHLKLQYRDTNAAFRKARNATCDVEDLLIIAGHKAELAVAKILPDLMKQEDNIWIPDTKARGYVKGVHILGEAARSQEAYAQIDNAYKAMAIAFVAAVPLAGGGAAIAAGGGANAVTAGTTLARLAIAADIFDMAYFGPKGIKEYLDGEEDYYTQLGLGPVLGPELAKEAAAKRSSPLAAIAGIVAPGISGLASLRALDDISKINRGRALVRSPDGLSSLDEISDTQRTDIASYYKHLKESEASTTARLSKSDQADLNKFNTYVDARAPVIDDAAASAKTAMLDVTPGSATPRPGASVDQTDVKKLDTYVDGNAPAIDNAASAKTTVLDATPGSATPSPGATIDQADVNKLDTYVDGNAPAIDNAASAKTAMLDVTPGSVTPRPGASVDQTDVKKLDTYVDGNAPAIDNAASAKTTVLDATPGSASPTPGTSKEAPTGTFAKFDSENLSEPTANSAKIDLEDGNSGQGVNASTGPIMNEEEASAYLAQLDAQKANKVSKGGEGTGTLGMDQAEIDRLNKDLPPTSTFSTERKIDIDAGQLKSADDAPYAKEIDAFMPDITPNARYKADITAEGRLREGAKITMDDGRVLELGKPFPSGGFTTAYPDRLPNPEGDKFVTKVTQYKGAKNPPAVIDAKVHDSEVGRKILEKIESESPYFSVSKRDGSPVVMVDPNDSQRKFVVTRDQDISDTVNGTIVSNAEERFAARGYDATRAERMTMQLALRKLNKKGVVWTDHKLRNFDIVVDKTSPTGHRIVYFDTDGFRPTAGMTAELRELNARQMQQIFDNAPSEIELKSYIIKNTSEFTKSFDNRAFAVTPGILASPGQNLTRHGYHELNALDAAGFKTEVDALSKVLGKPISAP